MNTRVFNYGGLTVNLFQSPQHGWVTTTPELARGCGVDHMTLERVCTKYNLVRKSSVVIDNELGSKLSLTTKGGPKPKKFWTVEGMTFVAMFLRTTQCEQFREEVLKTIKELEQQGFVNSKEVLNMIKALQHQIEVLNERIYTLESENRGLRRAGDFRASAAAYQMNARRVEKQYQH